MRYLTIIGIIIINGLVCFGQTNLTIPDTTEILESFLNLSDTVIRNEIASFNIKRSILKNKDSLTKVTLTEIPLRNCTENKVDFYKGSTFIHIYISKFDSEKHKLTYADTLKQNLVLIDNKPFLGTAGKLPSKKIDSIFLVTHSHFWVKFPDSAFSRLYEPNFCNFESGGKKDRYTSNYYKAFQSEDKRRIYIYMLNGNRQGRYEVTWVIKNDKFYTRVLDYVLSSEQ